MKEKKLKIPVRAFAFILLTVALFAVFTTVFQRKTVGGEWNHTVKINSFLNLEENTQDVIVFGSSHAYCSVDPRALKDDYGIEGYVLATQQQPLAATYYYMKEAFKTQSPKVVMLETYMVRCEEWEVTDAIIYDALDPLPLSANKLQMISALTGDREDKLPFYLTLFKYHSRWSELGVSDFTHRRSKDYDEYRGFVCLDGAKEQKLSKLSNPDAVGQINQSDLEYLGKLAELAKENNAELILYYAPYPISDPYVPALNAVKKYAEENGLRFINGAESFEDFGFDLSKDFYDGGHLNRHGAAKFTDYLGEYLTELPDKQ